MTFHSPSIWFALLLLLVPLVAWRLFVKRPWSAVKFSSLDVARATGSTWRTRLAWLPAALRVAALVVLVVALARPQWGKTLTTTDAEGIAIQMVVDRSGSMRAHDFELDGQPVDRLTALKRVAADFISGGEGLTGRTNDLVGLITFARFADATCPLTLDHGYTVDALRTSQIVSDEREDGTAIGDALGLAVERLQGLEDSRRDGAAPVKSKVIVLLTDGENNAGDLDPLAAATVAKTLGVKIYTIGVGTRGEAPVPVEDPFSGEMVMRWVQVSIDEETLTKLAEETGGQYFRATDTDSLERIYAEIDRLEKSKVEEQRFTDYRELAVQPFQERGWSFPPLLFAAFGLLAGECALSATLLRRFP
ncbi:MAG: VWA domain-containing protein [Pirellulales bacterium]|nr:VWA domain-containing protein [Pirellulales bacterium]